MPDDPINHAWRSQKSCLTIVRHHFWDPFWDPKNHAWRLAVQDISRDGGNAGKLEQRVLGIVNLVRTYVLQIECRLHGRNCQVLRNVSQHCYRTGYVTVGTGLHCLSTLSPSFGDSMTLYQCPIPETRSRWEHWVILNEGRSPEFNITKESCFSHTNVSVVHRNSL